MTNKNVFLNTSWTQHAPTSTVFYPQLGAAIHVNALSFQVECMYVYIYIAQTETLMNGLKVLVLSLTQGYAAPN